ncbi:MAG TPA: TolC family protein, partial [Cyclobacteriaceae bacterium]|nr:TolC family protein [Cyclobacteriaceae bacterium]
MRSILSGLVLISFLSGFSQTPVKVLKFEEAVTIGLRNNVLFNIQKNNLEYSQMQKMQSIAGMGPNISLNGNAARIDGNSFNPNTGTVVNGIRDNVTGSINANINLFSGLRQQNLVRQYANALDAQTYFVNRTSQDVINTVANQYLRVMLDVELVKIAKENFDALAKQLDQVKEQVNLGARGPVDEHNQDAQTKAAELRYIQAQITLNNDKAVLAQTILIDAL